MSYFSEKQMPYIMYSTTVLTSYAAKSSTEIDLRTANADSVAVFAQLIGSAAAGFSMTAQCSATSSTDAYTQLFATAGSSATVLTVASTVQGKYLMLDCKKVPNRYFRVLHVGTDAVQPFIFGIPYDSKLQKVPLSTDLASTVSTSSSWKQSAFPSTST